MRIGKFRVQNEAELWIVFDLTVTEPYRPTFLDGVSADNRIKNWINRLVDIFQQHSVTGYYRPLKHVQVVLLTQPYRKQFGVTAGTCAFSQSGVPSLKLTQRRFFCETFKR